MKKSYTDNFIFPVLDSVPENAFSCCPASLAEAGRDSVFPRKTKSMKSHFALTALAVVLAMNIGSGWTQRIDRQMLAIESSLCSDVDDRVCTERALDAQRKLKSRAAVCSSKA